MISFVVSLAVIYGIGVVWLSDYLHVDLEAAFLLGALPFIPLDFLKAVVAAPIAMRIRWTNVALPTNSRRI